MVVLAQNHTFTIDDISTQLGITKRSIYRYIEAFKEMGFVVKKNNSIYRLDYSSPFFKHITNRTSFSEDEALTISQVLNSVHDNSPQIRHLREKLRGLFDFKVLARHGIDENIARNLSTLFFAQQEERVVILREYRSHNSEAVADRIVEPFLFLSENSEVRCYELSSGMNKTFKISRIKRVDVLDLLWSNKDKHKSFFTDLFHFSGDRRFRVKLLLGHFAMSLLLEECPTAEVQLELQNDGRYLLDTEVCSFKGVGRFVLGLSDDIEVIDSPEFKQYLALRAKDLTLKFSE